MKSSSNATFPLFASRKKAIYNVAAWLLPNAPAAIPLQTFTQQSAGKATVGRSMAPSGTSFTVTSPISVLCWHDSMERQEPMDCAQSLCQHHSMVHLSRETNSNWV